MSAPACFTLPPTRNELPLDYAPDSPERAAVDAELKPASRRGARTAAADRRRGCHDRPAAPVARPARHATSRSPTATGRASARSSRRSSAGARRGRTGRGCLGGPRRDLPARGGARARAVARAAERRGDAQPEQDACARRRSTRPARRPTTSVQRPLHARDVRDAARVAARAVEPDEYRPLEGFVLRSRRSTSTWPGSTSPTRRRSWATSCSGSRPSRPSWCAGRARACSRRRGSRPASSISSTATARRSAGWRSLTVTWRACTSRARPRPSRRSGDDRRPTSRGYRNYPRIVGETGGKDFIVAHPTADAEASRPRSCAGRSSSRAEVLRASRMYIPQSHWAAAAASASQEEVPGLRVGDPTHTGVLRRRRDRRGRVRQASRGDRAGRKGGGPGSWSAASVDDSEGWVREADDRGRPPTRTTGCS